MGIMPCYPDDRSVENELGGKWELFFEETRDEAGNVGLEWDKDYDGVPLNLKGVLIILDKNTAIASASSTCRVKLNDDIMVNDAIISATSVKALFKTKVKNGLAESLFLRTTTTTPSIAITPFFSFAGSSTFFDNITSFSFLAQSITEGTKIRIYVLRGV